MTQDNKEADASRAAMPERIYINKEPYSWGMYGYSNSPVKGATEYIRADLVPAVTDESNSVATHDSARTKREALDILDMSEVISRGGRYVAVAYDDAQKIRALLQTPSDKDKRIAELEDYICKLVWEVTDGRMSRGYDVSTVKGVVNELFEEQQERVENEMREEQKALRKSHDRLLAVVKQLFAYGEDNQSTQHPWWAIVKNGAFGNKVILSGIYFSAQQAKDSLESQKYHFGDKAYVYCFGAARAAPYRKLVDDARQAITEAEALINATNEKLMEGK